MSDPSVTDPATEEAGHNQPEYSVGELAFALKRTVEGTFDRVRVRGEISGFKRAASGHMYMTLKDDAAVLDAVCWKGVAGRLSIMPDDGIEVIVTGKLTTYPARSKYQLVIESMEMAGEGALLKLLEDRRRKLAAEGLFEDGRKQAIPYLPGVIGVVTSPTGAVIRDILHRLADRFPRHVLIWPVQVQGEAAAAQIAAAIEGFNTLTPGGDPPRPDLLIVARGGGSVEDLWSFNEEVVVRAAAASNIPLISAVGHETDTTLIDFASDKRAPTPTAAAEMAVPVRADLEANVLDLQRRMVVAASRLTAERRTRLEGLSRGLRSPQEIVDGHGQRLDDLGERLRRGLASGVEQRRAKLNVIASGVRKSLLDSRLEQHRDRIERAGLSLDRDFQRLCRDAQTRLEHLAQLLKSYSYEGVLERGYAVVRSAGRVITRAAGAASGQGIEVQFSDGRVAAVVGPGGGPPAPDPAAPSTKPKAKAKSVSRTDDDPQGSLL